jgi:hypothetical protein
MSGPGCGGTKGCAQQQAGESVDSKAYGTLTHGNPEKSKSARIVPRPAVKIERAPGSSASLTRQEPGG